MAEDNKKENELVISPDVEKAVQTMTKFQQLKIKLLDHNDVVKIQNKPYIKRSGWRKIALAFGINTEIVSMDRNYNPNYNAQTTTKSGIKQVNGMYQVSAKVRATHNLTGRYAEEWASCDSLEFLAKNLKPTNHNIEAIAVTRAINRAISDLVGGGEVSAEEVVETTEEPVEMPIIPASKAQKDFVIDLGLKQPTYFKFLLHKLGGKGIDELSLNEASTIIEAMKEEKAIKDEEFQKWAKEQKDDE